MPVPPIFLQAVTPTVGFLSTPAGMALIGVLGSLLGAWFGTRSEIAKAVVRARIEREAKVQEREDERAEQRRQEEEARFRQAKLDEIEGIKDLRDSLRQRVKDQDEIIERLDARTRRAEDELLKARDEREQHGLERLEWFGERDELRRQLATAHEEIADLQECVRKWENLFQREELRVYIERHGGIPIRSREREPGEG